MTLDKEKRLADLKDEVRELHPLLKRLLPKLPSVQDVEYTHGSGEMGADFVVTRRHEVFGDPEYVGVIAKVGKIVQDYGGIERQIEECWVPRTLAGGKKKVRLNEIWVVITEHITKNAQEKIYDKYKTAKLEFVSGAKLAELIDKFIPDFWTDIQLDIGEHLSRVRDRNAALDAALSLIRVGDSSFYIAQDVLRVDSSGYSLQKVKHSSTSKPVDFTAEVLKNRMIVVEGEMGSGKSKLLRHTIGQLTSPEVFLEHRIVPFSLSYKEYVDVYGSNIDVILSQNLSPAVQAQLPEDVQYLLLIDGVDEKNQPLEEQIEVLQKLAQEVALRKNMRVVNLLSHR